MSIKSYDVLLSGSTFSHIGVPFNYSRGSAGPLDNTTVWTSLVSAEAYARGDFMGEGAKAAGFLSSDGNFIPYVGQLLTVKENDTYVTYIIENEEGHLKKVGDTESLNPTIDALSDAISVNTDNISVISSDLSALTLSVDAIKDATMGELGDLEKSLAESLSINISESAGATDGILKTYTFSQGGKDLDVKINIPKDFLVKSAKLETVVAEDIAEGGKLFDQGFAVGDKYIDFTVNAKADASEESHVYLNVKDLVDVYTGSEGNIVDIAVDGTTIKATVKANSIGFAQLCAEVKEYIDAQDAATYLSAKTYADTQDAATYLSATKYVDAVSAALSDDYVAKIGAAQDAAIAKAMEVSSAASAYTDTQIAAHDTAAKELLAQVSADAVTSALTDAKAYTDEKIGAIDYAAFAMLSDLESLSDEVSAISTDLEGKIGQTLTDAKAYADQTSANALADAKAYTDELCGSISVTVDQKIADLNIGQYAISSDVKAELCAVSAETLVSANDYTDEKVAAEAEARTKAIEDLSTALSGDVKALAEDYEATKADYAAVSADHEGRIDTLETGTTALSGRMDVAEGNITNLQNIVNSTDLSALALAEGDAQKVASKKYVDDTVASIGDVLHFIGVVAVPEGMDLTASEGYQALYPDGKTPTKGDVVLDSVSGNEYVYADNYKGEASWVVIGDENNHATKTELKAEEDARKAADTYLSGAIDNKIYYGDYGSVISADSLSVVKISQDDYHALVNGENGGIDDKAVYIVNSEGVYNMYDERIINVGAPISANDAATKAYVDAAKEEAIAAIPLSVSQLIWDIEQISCGGAFSF